MTPLRLFLLLLIAVLLPVRGVLATALPCSQGAGAASAAAPGPASAWALAPELPGGDHDQGHGQALHGSHHPADTGGHGGHHTLGHAAAEATTATVDPPAADTGSHHGAGCQAGACCLMPLGPKPPAAVVQRLSNQLRFPPLSAPVPAFESDGPERPPRRG